ncbi:MAG: sel1 repeat family protein [Gammaproteobacteria bacterium]|nr:sel1 repeat family protein [Gammaproteobacteria bacterium]
MFHPNRSPTLLALVFAAALPAHAVDFETAMRYHQYKDYGQAFQAFMELAQEGNAAAQANVAFYYDNGLAVARDPEEAARWYRLAADNGSVDAQYNLGAMYESGEGVEKDYGEAFKWFSLAAQQGDAQAAMYLGLFYEEGLGRASDDVQAYAWFHAAAGRGERAGTQKCQEVAPRLSPEQLEQAQGLGDRILEELRTRAARKLDLPT